MSEKKSSGKDRTRNWTFVIYPESLPLNWRDIIDEEHIQWVESPVHDKDINANGELKKPHLHILVMYDGVKTFEQIKELTGKLNAPMPQKVASAKGLVRYMSHMDNPEKIQYDKNQIIGHGGSDISELLKPTSSSRYLLIREMIEFVKTSEIIEICDLIEYAMTERFDDWFPLLCDNSSYIMNAVLKSYRHRVERPIKIVKVDIETGEIIN